MAVYTQIDNPELFFQCKIYTGTGSSNAITLDGDENMQPSMIWIKNRADSADHRIFDSVRTASKSLIPNNTDAEYNDTSTVMLSSFNSDGFTVVSHGNVNDSSDSHVAWCWKESATAGFDIVGHQGTSSAHTISHSLSAVPHLIISKNRDGTQGWGVYHHKNTSAPETDFLALNTNDATSDQSTFWNDTAPTSSVFSVGTSGWVNDTGNDYIVYLFSEKQGFSKFGSYTGNGNASGPMIWLGFRPAWLMIKKNSANDGWWRIQDNKREPHNVVDKSIFANVSDAEYDTSNYSVDFLSNGFKIRTALTGNNASGGTYIYMAFAEQPFVNSNGVPCNAR